MVLLDAFFFPVCVFVMPALLDTTSQSITVYYGDDLRT